VSRRLPPTGVIRIAAIFGLVFFPYGFCQTASPPSQSHQDAAQAASQPSLTETQWNLIELNGSPVAVRSTEQQPYIYLQVQGDRLSGSGGCNRFFGSFDVSGGSLQFHSVAQTMMACPGASMQREPELLEALKLVTSYQISGTTLQMRLDDRVLARFEAMKR